MRTGVPEEYRRLERVLRELSRGVIETRRLDSIGSCLGRVLESELPEPEARQLAWMLATVIEEWCALKK